MNFGEKPKKRITINITSLVDILIVLLLFFMLTTQFLHMEVLNLNLSGKEGGGEGSRAGSKTITITLPGENRFILNGSKYNLLQLKEVVKPLLESPANTDVIIIAKKAAPVQDVVSAMDYLKSIGASSISLAEDSENAGK